MRAVDVRRKQDRARVLREGGKTYPAIAEKLGVSSSTARRWVTGRRDHERAYDVKGFKNTHAKNGKPPERAKPCKCERVMLDHDEDGDPFCVKCGKAVRL